MDASGVLVTFVVRLLPDRLAAGELVGEVEHVGGGEHGLLQGASDLVGFAQRAAAGANPVKPEDEANEKD